MDLFGPSIEQLESNNDIAGLNHAMQIPKKRIEAILAIGRLAETHKIGHISSLEFLNKMLIDSDNNIRRHAATAISQLAAINVVDVTSIEYLNQALSYSDTSIQRNASLTLGQIAKNTGIYKDTSLQILNGLLKSQNWDVRRYASWALEIINMKEKRVNLEKEEMLRQQTISKAKQFEFALNYSKAATMYEELELWEDARRCRELMGGLSTQATVSNVKSADKPEKKTPTIIDSLQDENVKTLLPSILSFLVPDFIDTETSSQLTISFKNTTDLTFRDISVETSDLVNFFIVEGDINIPLLRPGMELDNYIRIKPRHTRGIFPVRIIVRSGHVEVVRECTIKVGGTEIY
jgi:hypothetical protein